MTLLELQNVHSYYGKSHVLHDVTMSVERGSLVTLIGRNGAGKSTTLKSIMGMLTPKTGTITFDGEDVTHDTPHERSEKGIALVPEHRRVFPDLTVEENLRLGGLAHDASQDVHDRVFEYFPQLEKYVDHPAGKMSGGEQQMLAIGRALVSDPDLLLIDEPTEGLMPSLVKDLKRRLVEINDDGTTILLVEQNANLALDISDYGYVIDEGLIQFDGPSEVLQADEEMKQRYLALNE